MIAGKQLKEILGLQRAVVGGALTTLVQLQKSNDAMVRSVARRWLRAPEKDMDAGIFWSESCLQAGEYFREAVDGGYSMLTEAITAEPKPDKPKPPPSKSTMSRGAKQSAPRKKTSPGASKSSSAKKTAAPSSAKKTVKKPQSSKKTGSASGTGNAGDAKAPSSE